MSDCTDNPCPNCKAAREAAPREIIYRFGVQPGLWVAVEDSHCLLLQITTPDGGTEIARSGPLSNGDDIGRGVELARVWVAGAEDDARADAIARNLARRMNPR